MHINKTFTIIQTVIQRIPLQIQVKMYKSNRCINVEFTFYKEDNYQHLNQSEA